MPNISLNSSQSKAATLRTMDTSQLAAQLTAGMTNRDMLIQLNGGSETIASDLQTTYRDDRQMDNSYQEFTDVETGDIVLTRTITWTYYDDQEGAPVDTIETIETDGDGNQTRDDVIKHAPDDSYQPILNPPSEIMPEPPVIGPGPIRRQTL